MNARPPTAGRAGTTTQTIEDAVLYGLTESGALERGEIVVHFDLVASTRRIVNGEEKIDRRHWASVGSDPHLSYAYLTAQAKKILRNDLT